MLQKPDLPDEAIAARLHDAYKLRAAEITFLPLGADQHTAVYRVVADDGSAYFLKLRSGDFDQAAVAVPRLLHRQGVTQVIPPIPTRAHRLWTRLQRFALTLSPFVDGSDGYTTSLSDAQWVALGTALSGIHAAHLPEQLARRIPRETFDPVWCDTIRGYQARAERERFDDPLAADLAALMRAERTRITQLVHRLEQLARTLRALAPPHVLCHGDLHAGNVLLGTDGALHVVDWDTLVYAPREHDLALIGTGWGGEREAALFSRGYAPIAPLPAARAYYRYRRIAEDIAVACRQLLDTREGGANRAQELGCVVNAFRPSHLVDIACRADAG